MIDQFNLTSTAEEVLQGTNLSGKCVLVTGVSAGKDRNLQVLDSSHTARLNLRAVLVLAVQASRRR